MYNKVILCAFKKRVEMQSKHVAGNIIYIICCTDGLFVGFNNFYSLLIGNLKRTGLITL